MSSRATPIDAGAPAGRAPRRDAQRNRALLIDVAATAFREDGLEVGVDELARRAKVGIATLYRHFPTKGDLVVAVYRELFAQLGEARDAALSRGRRDTSLQRFLRAALAQLADNRGLVEALARHPPDPAIRQRMREQALELLAPIAARAHETGELAPALDAEDLLVALRMLGAASSPEVARDAERYLQIVLRGLRG